MAARWEASKVAKTVVKTGGLMAAQTAALTAAAMENLRVAWTAAM